MSIVNMIISGLLKKGVLYESKNVDIETVVPLKIDGSLEHIRINIKAENVSLRLMNDKDLQSITEHDEMIRDIKKCQDQYNKKILDK